MHQFLEIIGIIVLSVVAIVVLIVMLRAGFRGPHYDQDMVSRAKHSYQKTKFNRRSSGLTDNKPTRCIIWTKRDDDYLKRLYNQHYSIEQISYIIGFRQSDIVSRLKKLKLR